MAQADTIESLKSEVKRLEHLLEKRTRELTSEITDGMNIRLELHKVQKTLRINEKQDSVIRNAVLENLPVALSLIDLEGNFWYLNHKGVETMSRPLEDILGHNIRELFPDENTEILKSHLRIFTDKKGYTSEMVYNIHGTKRHFEMIRQPIFDDSGEVSFVLSIGTEITERRRIEKMIQLQQSIDSIQSISETYEKSLEQLFDKLFTLEWVDAANIYKFTTGRDSINLIYHRGLSEEFIKATQKFSFDSPNSRIILNKTPHYSSRPEFIESTRDLFIKEGLTFACALPLVYKDEVIGTLNLASKSVTSLDEMDKMTIETITGRVAYLLILIQTQKDLINKNQELAETLENLQVNRQMLVQKGRLESLGELLAGLAHEINQPLSIISLALGNLETSLGQGEIGEEYLHSKVSSIMRNIDKIKDLINHVRLFSRDQGEMKFDQIDINQTIKNAISLVNEQMKQHHIEVVLDLDQSIGYAVGNPSRLEQVFLNLITNARDALDEKENTGPGEKFKKLLHITSKKNERKAIITFRDNGTGMEPEILERIFDPFFTTKAESKGTGLGLPIVYGIVSDMKGEIFAKSMPGKYTELTIILPAPLKK